MSVDSDQLIETEPVDIEANDSLVADTDVVVTDAGSTDATDGGVGTAEVMDDSAVSPPDPDAWRQSYEALGFQNLETPEQANQRMMEAYRRQQEQLTEASERIRYMQAVHSRLDNIAGGAGQSQSSVPSQEPSDLLTQISSGWTEPDRELLAKYVSTDDDGVSTWRSDTPAELRQQVDQWQLKQAAWHKVLSDPRQLDQAISQRVERMLETRLDGVLSERDTQQADRYAEEQFFAENDWMFERDPVTGGPYVNPVSGRPVLSRDGHQFSSALQRVQASGVGRISDQLQFALAIHRQQQTQVRQAPVQQRAAVQPVVAQQRSQMLGRTNKAPAKPTTSAGLTDGDGASRIGAKRQSFGQAIMAQLTEEATA